jgi:transcriptional regulator GlxA family with amidase domain
VRTVLIVLFDGVQALDVTGPLEVLASAIDHQGSPAYRVRTASLAGAPVKTTSGLAIVPDGDLRNRDDGDPVDLLIVPGGEGTRRRDPELVAWIRAHAPQAKRFASVCTGAILLAEAGLLDGRRATTHWAYCRTLQELYPAVNVDPDPIFIIDGQVATSAGVTAGIDLALALVEEDLGRDTALLIARHLVVYLRRPGNQAQFSAQLSAQVASRAPLRDVQQWITEHPADDLSVDALARRASMSPRHFARAFAAEVGLTPGRYVERTRLEAARRHLEDTAEGVQQTARACGYGTPEAMRRAFIETLGVSPAEYRRRFRPSSASQPEKTSQPQQTSKPEKELHHAGSHRPV